MFKMLLVAVAAVLVVMAYNSEYASNERECSFRPTTNVTECK